MQINWREVRQIAANAGVDGSIIVGKLNDSMDYSVGYDAAKREWCDLVKAGIIDPAKVERTALQDAASVAGLLIRKAGLRYRPGRSLDGGAPHWQRTSAVSPTSSSVIPYCAQAACRTLELSRRKMLSIPGALFPATCPTTQRKG